MALSRSNATAKQSMRKKILTISLVLLIGCRLYDLTPNGAPCIAELREVMRADSAAAVADAAHTAACQLVAPASVELCTQLATWPGVSSALAQKSAADERFAACAVARLPRAP